MSLYKEFDFEDMNTNDMLSEMTKDVLFIVLATPECYTMKRVDFFEFQYAGSDKINEEIFEKVILPSLIIELPDEEFYALNSETGFVYVEGIFSGLVLYELT